MAKPGQTPSTTLVLVRHGVTAHTTGRRFSGGLSGDNPPLSDEGRQQVLDTGRWLAESADRVDTVVASPVRRTRETADLLAGELGVDVVEEPGLAEMDFGSWDGKSFAEVAAEDKTGMASWFGDLAASPHGGESFHDVQKRVLAAMHRMLEEHSGRTVVVASHVTPIKTLVAHAVAAPLSSLFTLELAPASVSIVAFHPDPGVEAGYRATLRMFNALPPGRTLLGS